MGSNIIDMFTRVIWCLEFLLIALFSDTNTLVGVSTSMVQIVREQPNKNYFSVLWVIPKYFSAWCELIMSFIIPLVKGFDYWESFLMTAARVVGLFIPGFTAHFPVNYVNSTRLGKLNVPYKVEDLIVGDDIEDD